MVKTRVVYIVHTIEAKLNVGYSVGHDYQWDVAMLSVQEPDGPFYKPMGVA